MVNQNFGFPQIDLNKLIGVAAFFYILYIISKILDPDEHQSSYYIPLNLNKERIFLKVPKRKF